MFTILLILIVAGAVFAVVSAVVALRAYLGLRRARIGLQGDVTEEVEKLTARTNELQENLAALEARARELPMKISELQQHLARLQFLTQTLATSLRQARRILSYTELRTSASSRIVKILERRVSEALRTLR